MPKNVLQLPQRTDPLLFFDSILCIVMSIRKIGNYAKGLIVYEGFVG